MGGKERTRAVLGGRGRLLLAVALVVAGVVPASARANSQLFYPVADSYVNAAKPGGNFGGQSRLKVEGSPLLTSYLRFDVQLPAGATVSAASVDLYATSGSGGQDVAVDAVADSSWGEYSLSYQNAPQLGSQLGAAAPWTSSGYQTVALPTGALRAGLNSFAATSASAVKTLSFSSRETATPPRLRVSYSVGPAPPSNVSVTATSATSISVAWGASSDVSVVGYDLYRDGSAVASTSQTTYTFTGLSCGTSYTLGVDAYDAAGSRSQSVSLTGATGACPTTGAAPPAANGPAVPASGAYFGAWDKDPPTSWTEQGLSSFETMIGRKLNIDHRYYSFSDNFPYSFETWDLQNGRIPMISWDATGVTLDAINAGKYDTYFRDRATALKNLGHPVFLRPMYEMNGDWMDWDGYHNNTPGTTDGPAKYVQAWRRMHDIFMTVGATNVGWVWAPNSESVPADTWNDFRNYYPGDGYVDWVGVDGYNWGTSQTWSSWQSFASIFSNVYNAYAAIKPIMIAETSSCEAGGSKANWISDAAAAIKSMPAIHAIVWFNENMECDWRVNTSQSALDAFKAMGADAYFNPR